jgi:hypothetical protein
MSTVAKATPKVEVTLRPAERINMVMPERINGNQKRLIILKPE